MVPSGDSPGNGSPPRLNALDVCTCGRSASALASKAFSGSGAVGVGLAVAPEPASPMERGADGAPASPAGPGRTRRRLDLAAGADEARDRVADRVVRGLARHASMPRSGLATRLAASVAVAFAYIDRPRPRFTCAADLRGLRRVVAHDEVVAELRLHGAGRRLAGLERVRGGLERGDERRPSCRRRRRPSPRCPCRPTSPARPRRTTRPPRTRATAHDSFARPAAFSSSVAPYGSFTRMWRMWPALGASSVWRSVELRVELRLVLLDPRVDVGRAGVRDRPARRPTTP